MNDILKIILIAITGIILTGILKEIKSEYAIISSAVCGLFVLTAALPMIKQSLLLFNTGFYLSEAAEESLTVFFKCLLICEIGSVTKSLCIYNHNIFLSDCIDLAEKSAVLVLSIPLLKSVTEIIRHYIGV